MHPSKWNENTDFPDTTDQSIDADLEPTIYRHPRIDQNLGQIIEIQRKGAFFAGRNMEARKAAEAKGTLKTFSETLPDISENFIDGHGHCGAT